MDDKILTRKEVQAAMTARNLRAKKQFGQNFLVDGNILRFISGKADLGPKDLVLEVGVGNANLTLELVKKSGLVVGVEIDNGLFEWAKDRLGDAPNLKLIHADILENKNELNRELLSLLKKEIKNYSSFKIVSNLPYAIATPFLMGVFTSFPNWDRMILTLQRDMGERIFAKSGHKNSGPLAMMVWRCTQANVLKNLPEHVFWPKPAVESIVIQMKRREDAPNLEETGAFLELLHRMFQFRRKTLSAGFKKILPDSESLEKLRHCAEVSGFALDKRAEEIPAENVWRFFEEIRKEKLEWKQKRKD